jgi:hypothetical protein
MANWTVDQVGEWLKANGLEKFIKTFKGRKCSYCWCNAILYHTFISDEDIDGAALTSLQDGEILKLLTLVYEDGTMRNPTSRAQRKFMEGLEEYRTLVKQEKRAKRRSR